jgi:hypothetical protein
MRAAKESGPVEDDYTPWTPPFILEQQKPHPPGSDDQRHLFLQTNIAQMLAVQRAAMGTADDKAECKNSPDINASTAFPGLAGANFGPAWFDNPGTTERSRSRAPPQPSPEASRSSSIARIVPFFPGLGSHGRNDSNTTEVGITADPDVDTERRGQETTTEHFRFAWLLKYFEPSPSPPNPNQPAQEVGTNEKDNETGLHKNEAKAEIELNERNSPNSTMFARDTAPKSGTVRQANTRMSVFHLKQRLPPGNPTMKSSYSGTINPTGTEPDRLVSAKTRKTTDRI